MPCNQTVIHNVSIIIITLLLSLLSHWELNSRAHMHIHSLSLASSQHFLHCFLLQLFFRTRTCSLLFSIYICMFSLPLLSFPAQSSLQKLLQIYTPPAVIRILNFVFLLYSSLLSMCIYICVCVLYLALAINRMFFI